ncbi:class I SAM-dependent methyltransferase [Sphingomonas sp. KR1UV-12]|uniref:Class I SAM-dependent methyltransferase n=1 Tax=Sphingomonas aurea TaxID=3063994 RepID=A0ABT9EGZ4_9SPHN|nr:class I SAM-dependent methyltransferase [Sphingomonas sp. KR1UV-12]MDP1026053.1 class I SAM-dependent methyltransferase [Sphingomonas sp. KR1UV-12]
MTIAPVAKIRDAAERLLAAGRLGEAAQLLTGALGRIDAGDRPALAPLLARTLGAIDPPGYHPRFETDLLACFALPADHQLLARTTARLLLHKYRNGWSGASGDVLLTTFLSHCINVDPAMERQLLKLRAKTRDDALMTALALQAEANEYVWPNDRPAAVNSPLVSAMFARPSSPKGLPPSLADRLFAEPARRAALAAMIPHLGSTGDAVSGAVREHYDDNPYPRWQALPAPRPGALIAHIRTLPGLSDFADPARLLVAGCGTGYEAIDLAGACPTAEIVALDLSATALGHAASKAEDAGIATIRWLCGDILALPALTGQSDVATSTGVIHHMADPAAGLAAVAAAVRPGGVVRVAVYSRRARTLVAQAHALIAEQGWQPDLTGIRALRAHILALPAEAPLAALRDSDDFYSASGCRDLLFHRYERTFDLPDLLQTARGAGLLPLALDVDGDAARRYAELLGKPVDLTDFTGWQRVEAHWPQLFAGMYHLWCRKP